MAEKFKGTDQQAIAEFEKQKAELVKQGQHPIQAVKTIAKRDAGLHTAFLRATQPTAAKSRAVDEGLEQYAINR